MSLPDRRRRAVLALALLPALGLAGCFRPMYATVPGAPALTAEMAAIAVDEADTRVAMQVRNNLSFGLTGGAGVAPEKYRLSLRVLSTLDTAIVDSRVNTPQIDVIVVSGSYRLTDAASGSVLAEGKAYARKSYDRGVQRFAAVRAARDAEDAAAAVVAEQIKTRIAAVLSGRY